MVDVAWTDDDFDSIELDYPTEEGATTLGRAIGSRVLWNKADIVFEEHKPASKTSQPSSSPLGGPSDDDEGDDKGGDSNNNVGGHGSPRHSPAPNTSSPEGGTGGAPGKETTPPKSPKGSGQCPPAPKKQCDIYPEKPPKATVEQWATYQIGEKFQYNARYTTPNLCVQVYSEIYVSIRIDDLYCSGDYRP